MYRNDESYHSYSRRAAQTGREQNRAVALALPRPNVFTSFINLLPLLLISFLITLIIVSLVLILLGL